MFNFKKSDLSQKNSKIGIVHAYIKKHFHEKLEFWENIGGNRINNALVNFSEREFKNLILEVPNWSTTEQNILTDAIAYGIDRKFNKSFGAEQRKLAEKVYAQLANGFEHPKRKKWKNDFRVNSKTKSVNKWVLEMYDIIMKDEQVDTDFWYLCGKDYFYNYYLKFKAEDWNDLMSDMQNWTSTQQEILCIILTTDSPSEIDPKYLKESDWELIARRSQVYTTLLAKCREDVFWHIIDELKFMQYNTYKNFETLNLIKKRYEKLMDYYMKETGKPVPTYHHYYDYLEYINTELKGATTQ